jgi:hypothetical protein
VLTERRAGDGDGSVKLLFLQGTYLDVLHDGNDDTRAKRKPGMARFLDAPPGCLTLPGRPSNGAARRSVENRRLPILTRAASLCRLARVL